MLRILKGSQITSFTMNAVPSCVFVELCNYLDPHDLICLEKVCKNLNNKVKSTYIWKKQLIKQGATCRIQSAPWFVYKRATLLCKIMNRFAYTKRLLIWNNNSIKHYQIKLVADNNLRGS